METLSIVKIKSKYFFIVVLYFDVMLIFRVSAVQPAFANYVRPRNGLEGVAGCGIQAVLRVDGGGWVTNG